MSSSFPVVKGVLLNSKHYTWNTADSLGKGASAVVYLGRKKDSGLVVAVKSFHKAFLASAKHGDLREMELLRQLNHLNIIKMLDIQVEESNRQPVLVMEYCEGGSLHHMLDLPLYYFGLPEQEYLLVLTHVADGMAYLRRENIIHRDIKPGNIMRFITEEGKSIYKLTDFGAARNLHEEEQFESLYGTEEYLHPGVYAKAVLRHSTGKSFDARVDLWSLGVTFFHAATGQLPFRAFGGRNNRETMYEIISKKESGVISGVQRSANGSIEWQRDLPNSCPLSNGLRALVTPVLSGLMESDQGKMISYDTLFRIVASLQHKTTLSLFHFASGQEVVIYLDQSSVYSDLQDIVTSQFDIAAADQLLLFEGRKIDQVVDASVCVGNYPVEITGGVIFLFQTSARENIQLKEPDIDAFPNVCTYNGMEADSKYANSCCAVGERISRCVNTATKQQELMLKGIMCLRLYVSDCHTTGLIRLEVAQQLMHEFESHLDSFFFMLDIVRSNVPHANPADRQKMEEIRQEKIVRPVFEKAKDRLGEIHRYRASTSVKLEAVSENGARLASQCNTDKCCERVAHHLSVIGAIQNRFRRDKNVRHQMTSHDENIHQFEKQKLEKHCVAMRQLLVSHCFANQAKLFQDAIKVADCLIRTLSHVSKIEINITSVINCQTLLSKKTVTMRDSCKDLCIYSDSGYGTTTSTVRSFSSTYENVSSLTKGLESKLVDLKQQIEGNSHLLQTMGTNSASLSSFVQDRVVTPSLNSKPVGHNSPKPYESTPG